MSTNMPIANHLFRGGLINGANNQIDHQLTQELRNQISRSELFEIQVASDLVTKETTLHYGPFVEKLGPLNPPFGNVWMEWKWRYLDPSMADTLLSSRITADLNCGVLVGWDREGGEIVITLVLMVGNSYCRMVPEGIVVHIDEHGIFERLRTIDVLNDQTWTAVERELTSSFAMFPLMALSLTNCKNVSTDKTGSINLGRTGSQKRRKIPARKIKYHTIMLPGGGTQSDGHGGHRATAIHRVRGHFKTFTAEKPLMGQHVGTYWWGWQVRGKAENGIVVSDYKVGVQ